MKKIAIAAAALTVGVLTAGAIESANTFVTIKATSSTTNTVIAVPLVNIGTGNTALNVTNFVLTTGLKDGATLTVKHTDGNWYAFRKNNGTWEGVYTVNNTNVNVPSGAETIERGGAAMLHNEFDGDSFDFYLYGQLATGAAEVTPAANAVSAIANANLAPVALSAITTKTGEGFQNGDYIKVVKANGEGLRSYKYDSGWKKKSGYTTWVDVTDEDVIPVGTGFWYVSNSSTVPTITWGAQN